MITAHFSGVWIFRIFTVFCFQDNNDTYRYLSGIPVTPRTQFLQLSQPEVLQQYQLVIHYMKFAMAAYGWPIFMMMNTGTGLCKLMPYLRYVTWSLWWLPMVGPSLWWWIQGLDCALSQVCHMRFAMAAYSWPISMMMNTGTGLCKLMPYLRYGWPKWTRGLPWLPMVGPSSWRWIQGLDCVNWCLISGMDDQNEHEVCHGCLRLGHLHEGEYRNRTV